MYIKTTTSWTSLVFAGLIGTALAMPAQADDAPLALGTYFGLGAGISQPVKTSLSNFSPAGVTPGFASFDTGFNVSGSVGYRWRSGLRGEIEYSYRQSDLNHLSGLPTHGEADADSLMGNVLYDFNTHSSLTPYIGGGIGVGSMRWNQVHDYSYANFANLRDSGFQWQLIGGVEKQVNRHLSLFAEYRYIGLDDLHFRGFFSPENEALGRYDDRSHNILVGIRWHPGGDSSGGGLF